MASNTTPLVQTIDPPTLGPGNPCYANITLTPLSTTTSLATISGQPPIPPPSTSFPTPTPLTPVPLKTQLRTSLHRIQLCLDHVNARKADLIRLVYYIAEEFYEYEDDKSLGEVVEVVTEWLEGSRPASCCLVVKGLTEKGWGCEVEASCVVRGSTEG